MESVSDAGLNMEGVLLEECGASNAARESDRDAEDGCLSSRRATNSL